MGKNNQLSIKIWTLKKIDIYITYTYIYYRRMWGVYKIINMLSSTLLEKSRNWFYQLLLQHINYSAGGIYSRMSHVCVSLSYLRYIISARSCCLIFRARRLLAYKIAANYTQRVISSCRLSHKGRRFVCCVQCTYGALPNIHARLKYYVSSSRW